MVIHLYLGRSIQERYRQSADAFGGGEQYAKGVTRSVETASQLHIPDPEETQDFCENLQGQTAALEKKITDLQKRISTNEVSIRLMNQEIMKLRNANPRFQGASNKNITRIEGMIGTLRNKVGNWETEEAGIETVVSNLKQKFPYCF